jgi:uncharacterized protein (TIRG00374 family)
MEGFFLHTSLNYFDEKFPLMISMRYALIINSIGYFVSLGGVSAFATQIHVLDHYNIDYKKSTITRMLHLFLFNLLFDIMLVVGFIFILLGIEQKSTYVVIILIINGFFICVRPGLYLALFWKSFRMVAFKVIFLAINAVLKVFKKESRLDPQWLIGLFDEFQDVFKSMIDRPLYLLMVSLITIIIYIFWIGVMYFSFITVNYPIKIGVLALGFATGQIVGVLSMVPGGIGTLEGSSSLVYAALGVPFETALSALLIYRMTYNVIPFLLSLPFYFTMKTRSK